jgi:hypothetical protein
MHITGKNGNTSVFSGTDVLSESGVTSGYQEYTGGFDFAGTITKLTIEVGGRDINLAIGPLFDDVRINVLYNVVSTIVTQSITSVEMWVAYGGSTETEVIDIVENIFDHNDIVVPESPGDDMFFEPEFDEPDMEVSYETVEMEMEMPSFEMDFEMELPEMDIEMPEVEVAVVEVEMEMEMELELEMPAPEPEMTEEIEVAPEPDTMEPEIESEPEMEEPINEPESEPETETEPESVDESTEEDSTEPETNAEEESESEESVQETEADESESEDLGEAEDKSEDEAPVKKPESKKEKAAKKIVKKMGDKGRYDSTNQLKTLIVMQVLGDTKTFFDSQKQLEDRLDFFTDYMMPDAEIQNNNIAQWYLFSGSDGMINDMIELQWQNSK